PLRKHLASSRQAAFHRIGDRHGMVLANFDIHVTEAPYSFCPNHAMSPGVSSFETTASLPCTISRICSTTSGFASVVTSPTSRRLEIEASTRRMIFPERVLGISGGKKDFARH